MADYQQNPSSEPWNHTPVSQEPEMSAKTVTVTAPVQRTPLSRPVSRGVPTEELFILVLGQPGVGKTSFINTVSNSTLRISSGADGAEGEKLELSLPFFVDGKAVRLIDTPAFGDPNKSDTEVLTAIASYLASEYTNSRKLAGVIYLHSIAATRLRGPGRRNLSLFTKLCGKQALANVAIVTTRWDQVDLRSGEAREVELQSKPTLLKPLVEAGATLFRYIRSDDVAALSSAQNIIRYFLHRPALPLLVQQEMVDDGQLIPETTAGRALHKEYRTQLDELQKNMQDLRLEYDELKKENRMAIARKVKSEMIAIKEAAEKLKEESKKLSGAKMTILPSQPLKLLISPTAVEQATAAAQPRARRRSSTSPSPFGFPSSSVIPPLPQNPPSALRTPRVPVVDKGKGREVDSLPVEVIQPHPLPVRIRKRSSRRRDDEPDIVPTRRRSSRRRRRSDSDSGEIVLALEGWEEFRYALVGVVIFLILIPFLKRSQMAY